MLNNKADTIEEYILKKLSEEQAGSVELKRTELAGEVSCAPSQISYVLSTRFTYDKGFIVESRRGLGGYIKITIIRDKNLEKKLLYEDMLKDISAETPFAEVKSMMDYLLEQKLVTIREAELSIQMIAKFYRAERDKIISSEVRAEFVRSIFITLSKIT
ncbi:MAG: CtsR family transcriptional regulator [Selenomonadaceae bacterium]|nr:CtsR family transcriptional regulator [Selenomonadaceae bacterium]